MPNAPITYGPKDIEVSDEQILISAATRKHGHWRVQAEIHFLVNLPDGRVLEETENCWHDIPASVRGEKQ